MGFIKHDAIVVTCFIRRDILAAAEAAEEFGLTITPLVFTMNDYGSFLIAPDGSKEGWDDSDLGDARREKWKNWARESLARGVFLDWVHISYPGDPGSRTEVVDDANAELEGRS